MADRDVTNPADSDLISAYPANERAQREAQSLIFNEDHFDPDDPDQGKHRQVRMKEILTAPATATNQGALYLQEFNGIAELFWGDELGNETRLTFKGELVVNLQFTDVVVGSLRTNNFFRGRRRTVASVAGVLELDFETATVFETTIFENTTVTLTNMPNAVDGEEQTVYIDVTNGGAFTTALASAFNLITPGGVIKPLTVAGRDLVILTSHDGLNILTDVILDFK